MHSRYENLKFFIREDIIGNVQRLSPVFDERMQELSDKYKCLKQYRAIGLFGAFDVQDASGGIPKLQHQPAKDENVFQAYKRAYAEAGLVGLHRYPHIHSAPPLVINREELEDGFDRLDRAISVLDHELSKQ